MDTKNIVNTMVAILAMGAVLNIARQVPVVNQLAAMITKGYGE